MAAPVYFRFESCCTGETHDYLGPSDPNSYWWTTIFPALPTVIIPNINFDNLVQGQCYLVTIIAGPGMGLQQLPGGSSFGTTDGRSECYVYNPATDKFELFGECFQCPPCYFLMSCDGTVMPFTTNQDLSAYLYSVTNQSWEMYSSDWDGAKCFKVLQAPIGTQCDESTSPIIVTTPCDCPCICYTVIASAKGCQYIDCDGNLQTILGLNNTPIKFCSSVYPFITGNSQLPTGPSPIYIYNEGLCVDGECPDVCYLLEDCEGIQDPIYSTSSSLSPYAIIGQIVVLDNYPGTCWEVTDTVECDCAIDVTVIQSYDGCSTCLNPSNYKLINCDDKNTIIYTSSDLSAYVGQVVIIGDCPGCWFIEEIENIPSDVAVTITESYLNCTECAKEYYELTDCTGFKDPIITYTDLSQYLGSVIKIKYCPETCWTVNATNDPTDAGIVIPEVEYIDCPECLLTFPCICTTVRNDSTTSKDYRYYDCNLDVQFFTLAPGEKSEKFCIRVWAIYFPETDYIETYNNCLETTPDIWECPAVVYPRRSVQPGYNTPACTIAKYEKISCKSAEVYYKQVLYLRYGISDCCPDENDKWLIKKELIDMDALRDPNYECTVSTCGCPSQSCSCNATITTCNSQ